MAARKSPLRVAKPGEKAVPSKPKTITEAATGGTHRELLAAMRDRIAVAVEDPNTPARDLAALTKRLADVAREITHLDAKADQEGESHGGVVEDGDFDASAV
jgi:hypothetical protein